MRRLLYVFCAIATLAAQAGELRSVPLFRYGIIADNVGAANFVLTDITGDSRPEIISCSGAPFALEYRDGAYAQFWYGRDANCSGVAAGDANGDGATEIITAGATTLALYDPHGLGKPRMTVTLPATAYDVAFGNVDFDATPEIVVVAQSNTYVYDAATLALQWTATGHGGNAVKIADVDGDARKEIVLSGGAVLDAGNQVHKWGYLGGFPMMAVGNVDADAKDEILYATSVYAGSVTILHGDTMQTSTLTGLDYLEQLLVGDADGDGVNEVITGNNQWGDIAGHRATDGVLLWNIHNPEHGCMGLAVGDVDGDGGAEVVWGSGWTSSGKDALFVGSATTETIEWTSPDLDGAFSVATGDLDGDGRLELVVASARSDSGYRGAEIEIFDARTGISKGLVPHAQQFWSDAQGIAIGQLDADPAKEIAVAGSQTIYVIDGVTRQLDWYSGASMAGMAVANVDGDAMDEIITITNGQLIVLHGASNFIQASRAFSSLRHVVAAGDVNGDGIAEVMTATSDKLHLLNGSLATLQEKSLQLVAAIAATSLGGGRIAVLIDTSAPTVSLFDQSLTQQWSCASTNSTEYSAIALGTIAGEPRIAIGDENGKIHLATLGGSSCPAFDSRSFAAEQIHQLRIADVTADGSADVVFTTWRSAEYALAGLPSQTRGDVDGDGVVTSADVTPLVDFIFGAAPGLSTAGDATADERLSGEDIFALIHHLHGGSLPD
ncbi:MAG TPA: FG-GAP-like repeat-containing protein [Thermoanaerobaculia bacterium]|nr:FG-GAP-like repeat-containing protein [Thermoanaerobaculia bacterium]